MTSENDIKPDTQSSRYGRIAALYEWGAYHGSGGQIQESKKYHLSLLNEPCKILYPGVGWGKEVVLAVKAGHHPVVVELDEAMLEKAKSIFEAEGVLQDIECIQGNILDHDRPNTYDAVVASYLLDVFSPTVMPKVYEHLVAQVKPEGLLCLSGYSPLSGSLFHRVLQRINHAYANFFCRIVVNNATHGIYNYAEYFSQFGLQAEHQHDFPHFGDSGPRFHRFWAAKKIAGDPTS